MPKSVTLYYSDIRQHHPPWYIYRKASNIRRTKSQNLNTSRLIL